MKNTLVYLCYGNEDYFSETLFSLLSFYKHHKNSSIDVVIYTTQSDFFKSKIPFSIDYIDIDAEQIKIWSGAITYNHRSKVKVLEDITAKRDGNFLFIDSDTVFRANCEFLFAAIEKGILIADICEGKLYETKGGIAKKLIYFFKKQTHFSTEFDDSIVFDNLFEVWNTGTIGINTTTKSILPKVVALVDELYTKYPLFVMEQISFSYYFQTCTKPISSANYIHHYWYFKEFRSVLKVFFNHHANTNFEILLDEIEKIKPEYLSLEKQQYKAMNFWQKQFQKITKGRKWKILNYEL